jgi:hypothetical protein
VDCTRVDWRGYGRKLVQSGLMDRWTELELMEVSKMQACTK